MNPDRPAPVTLAQRLANVAAEIGAVPKSGWNDFHKFGYIKYADVLAALPPAMARQGVFITQQVLDLSQRDIVGATKTQIFTLVKVEFSIHDGQDATATPIICQWYGESIDTSDKGISKAMSLAHKSFIMKTFMVTDSDPDGETAEEISQKKQPPNPGAGVPAPKKKFAREEPPHVEVELNPDPVIASINKLITDNGLAFIVYNTRSLEVFKKPIGQLNYEQAVEVLNKIKQSLDMPVASVK